MKKIVLVVLALLSGATAWYVRTALRSKEQSSRFTASAAQQAHVDAVLVCTNVRVTHIKNQWASAQLSTPEAYVTSDHHLHAAYVVLTGTSPHQEPVCLTAHAATFDPKARVINVQGLVDVQQRNGIQLQTNRLQLSLSQHTVQCDEKVLLQHPHGTLQAGQLVFNYSAHELACADGVQSEFVGLKRPLT
jgi:LPS export ABC transporter protein LptC